MRLTSFSGSCTNLEEGLLSIDENLLSQDDEDVPSSVLSPQEGPPCTPISQWNGARKGSVVLVVLVTGLVVLTWIPETVFRSYDVGVTFEVVGFHLLLVFLLVAYLHAIFVDPGSVPDEWSDFIARLPQGERARYAFCPKTQRYKPARAHYCSATQRLVLNMDHFCPWVCNTVGFYNRKFFVQFLIYSAMTLLYAWVGLTCRVVHCMSYIGEPGCGYLVYVGAVVDGVLGCLMAAFAAFHVHLVLTNTTSIELAQKNSQPADAKQAFTVLSYNLGARDNWRQVFGANPCYWFLPIWGNGPVGDGLKWPTHDATAEAALAAATVLTNLDSVAANTYLNMDQDPETASMASAGSDYVAIEAQSQPQSLL